jgi:general secretion pathway protein G
MNTDKNIGAASPSSLSVLRYPSSVLGRGAASAIRHPLSVLGGFAAPLSPISYLLSPGAKRPSATRHSGFAAFTLIELLVVVAVIAILAGITMAAMGGVQEKAARDRARAEIAAIANAIEQFRNINDTYPPEGATNLYTAIAPFFETQNSQVSSNALVDPFGNPYQYSTNRPNMRNPASFDLWSPGKNPETNDDIGNW